MKITDINFKSNFEKLLAGLIEGNDIPNFSVDKNRKSIQILVGEWYVELLNDGNWRIC